MAVAEIFTTMNTINAVRGFLEAGSVADVLEGIEFEAASKAFREVALAKDKRIQIGVCIGHLNSCLVANRKICANTESIFRSLSQVTLGQRIRLDQASEKIRFLLILLAFCYAYLGERELCLSHLDAAEVAEPWKGSKLGVVLTGAYLLTSMIALPLFYPLELASPTSPEPLGYYKLSDDDLRQIRASLSDLL